CGNGRLRADRTRNSCEEPEGYSDRQATARPQIDQPGKEEEVDHRWAPERRKLRYRFPCGYQRLAFFGIRAMLVLVPHSPALDFPRRRSRSSLARASFEKKTANLR